MVEQILFACLLIVVTVIVHVVSLDAMLRVIFRSHALSKSGFLRVSRFVIVIASWLLLTHLAEIAVWGLFYFWRGLLPRVNSALYFSAGAYTTVGAVDLELPEPWRIFAPLEALTATLMCGLSTGLFFAIVSRWIDQWMKRGGELGTLSAEPSSATSPSETKP